MKKKRLFKTLTRVDGPSLSDRIAAEAFLVSSGPFGRPEQEAGDLFEAELADYLCLFRLGW